ncbi:MAG TPA: hypothetical protein VG757_10690 [Devosia sp.]|nr:hypothetical protein [Devosia sp.]
MTLRAYCVRACLLGIGLLALAGALEVRTATAGGNADCPGIRKFVTIGTSPTLVNPGGNCAFGVMFSYQQTVPPTVPKYCLYARGAGNSKTYGPFCNDGPANMLLKVPRLEWLWSADRPLHATVMLTPYQKRR